MIWVLALFLLCFTPWRMWVLSGLGAWLFGGIGFVVGLWIAVIWWFATKD